ncbi:MAG: RsmB/NOP family class I SAM-dependent RNA methyltransferase [Alphaproteobacteria bacterium]
MTPASRIQASIELISSVISQTYPADTIITHYFRSNRYIGSKDRRQVSSYTYGCLRHYFQLQWGLGKHSTPRLLVFLFVLLEDKWQLHDLQNACDSNPYHPQPLSTKESATLKKALARLKGPLPPDVELNIPAWSLGLFQEAFGDTHALEVESLSESASFDLRVNTLKTTRDAVMKSLDEDNIPGIPTPLSPLGVRLAERRPLPAHPLWRNGWVEVQDEGSQLVSLLVGAKPQETVLDLCAGAGGKTLALGATMLNKGHIVAMDISEKRLERARERLRRAGVHNTEFRAIDAAGQRWLARQSKRFDRVLIDAPCSGSGTWRRNPDLKLRFQESDLEEIMGKQAYLLAQAIPLIRPGGYLIYVTCSLFTCENQQQIADFLEKNAEFTAVPMAQVWEENLGTPYPSANPLYLQLTPHQHNCDGFFMAVLRKMAPVA